MWLIHWQLIQAYNRSVVQATRPHLSSKVHCVRCVIRFVRDLVLRQLRFIKCHHDPSPLRVRYHSRAHSAVKRTISTLKKYRGIIRSDRLTANRIKACGLGVNTRTYKAEDTFTWLQGLQVCKLVQHWLRLSQTYFSPCNPHLGHFQ